MKKYFKGYYCVNKEEIETIGKNSNRIIIDILKDSYPNGLNANQIAEKTNMPIKTIYNQLQDLSSSCFIESTTIPRSSAICIKNIIYSIIYAGLYFHIL